MVLIFLNKASWSTCSHERSPFSVECASFLIVGLIIFFENFNWIFQEKKILCWKNTEHCDDDVLCKDFFLILSFSENFRHVDFEYFFSAERQHFQFHTISYVAGDLLMGTLVWEPPLFQIILLFILSISDYVESAKPDGLIERGLRFCLFHFWNKTVISIKFLIKKNRITQYYLCIL